MADVLKKTGLKAQEIDILIINCSLFSPTPSLCAMVANKFKMRDDIESYNLSGVCFLVILALSLPSYISFFS